MVDSKTASPDRVSLSADIVAAYVTHNSVPPNGLPALIESVHSALTNLGAVEAVPQTEALVPAVPIRKSVTPGFLICLDDGKKFKSLRRHLGMLGMTPEQYRIKWEPSERLPNGRARLRCHAVSAREVDWTWAVAKGHRETETGTHIQGGRGDGSVLDKPPP